MAFWVPLAAAGIAAAGSIGASALAGGGGSGSSYPSNRRETLDMYRQQIKQRVLAARDAGISPLAALGVASGGGTGGIANSGSVWTDGLADAAGHLGRGLQHAYDERNARSAEAAAEERERDVHAARLGESAALRDKYKAESYASMAYADSLIARTAQLHHSGLGKAPDSVVLHPGEHMRFRTDRTNPQEVWEDEYGGIVGEVYGLQRFARNLWQNVKREADKYPHGPRFRPLPRRKPGYGASGQSVTIPVR